MASISFRLLLIVLVVFQAPLGQVTFGTTPNFVLVILDDLSWVGTSVQMDPNNPDSKSDYHRTPNMEILASQGMVFSNAYAAGPMCSPTRAAIISGKTPAQLHVTDVRNSGKLDNFQFLTYYHGYPLTPAIPQVAFPNQTTLAEALKQVDPQYKAGFYGKSDWWPDPLVEGYDSYETEQVNNLDQHLDPKGMYDITNRTTNYMQEQVQANKPFFVTLGHYAVKPHNFAFPETRAEFDDVPLGTKHYNQDYAAMHLEVDKTLGLVMDKIASLGVEDNTYVILTSDHGAATGVHDQEIVNAPLYGGKGTIWEGGLRVPLIVKGPGITSASYSNVSVSSIDLLPTLVDLAGGTGPLPAGVEGTSFASVLQNDGQLPVGQTALSRPWGADGELFFHYPHYGPNIPIGGIKPASVIVDGDYKLVRFYGENGAPDQHFLFNLAANLAESNDVNSPLNLASQMPEKVLEMNGKLQHWLEGVDAVLPYDVRDPVTLTWKADQPGAVSGDWRSVNNVDHYDREVWSPKVSLVNPAAGAAPVIVDVESHQPKLSKKAFAFEGNDGLYRQFIHVSDNNSAAIDGDHSATFQTWVRFDDLANEQLLFEAGESNRGLSLTLGDANGDSIKNDLRFRVLGKSGNYLTLTTEIDKFADPTQDFMQITAVISDTSDDRYLEIYINGALANRINGVAGNAALDWDSFFQASLGGVSPYPSSIGFALPDTLGGAVGNGLLPFTGGKLKGQIAEFEFHNYALTADQIRDHYNSYLDPVDAGLRVVSDEVQVPLYRPSDVSLNAAQSSSLLVFEERRDILNDDLTINALVTGPLELHDTDQGMTATLTAGTEFTSYLLHFDPTSNNGSIAESVLGSIEFDEKIIGIVFDQSLLAQSDATLGVIGNYGQVTDRGFFFGPSDYLTVSADQLSLDFNISVLGDDLVQFRVLTEKLSFLTADFNLDGFVDSGDLSVWQAAFGVDNNGDADGDGDTDGRDFLVWQRQFSPNSSNQLASNALVPEPSSLLLVMASLALAVCFRRRSA